MADMQITIRFWWQAGLYARKASISQIFSDGFMNKIS